MAGKVADFTDQSWEKDVMKSAQPVLVDFWGEWCQPCKALVPILEDLAQRFDGRLRVGKLDVAENDQAAYNYNVTTLPTLLLIKNGVVAEQHVGSISRDKLVRLVEQHL